MLTQGQHRIVVAQSTSKAKQGLGILAYSLRRLTREPVDLFTYEMAASISPIIGLNI